MEQNEKQITTITKHRFIRLIAKNSKVKVATVERVHSEWENQLMSLLASADENNDVVVKMFDGFTVSSTFLPEREQLNKLTGDMIVAQDKIQAVPRFTRTFKDKITKLARELRKKRSMADN